jgi:Oxidoreductase molybdopterin binding domain
MNSRSVSHACVVSIAAVVLCVARADAAAQEMDHSRPTVPSTQLTVKAPDGKSITFTPEDIAAMPHKSVSVYNSHAKANETYSGVSLADLLGKVGVPLGESVRGKLFLIGVVAEGTDHYGVLYSLAEVDPSIHAGDVIVADSMDGQKLGKDGAFKVVSTEEKRPARWVRNLDQVTVVEVKR